MQTSDVKQASGWIRRPSPLLLPSSGLPRPFRRNLSKTRTTQDRIGLRETCDRAAVCAVLVSSHSGRRLGTTQAPALGVPACRRLQSPPAPSSTTTLLLYHNPPAAEALRGARPPVALTTRSRKIRDRTPSRELMEILSERRLQVGGLSSLLRLPRRIRMTMTRKSTAAMSPRVAARRSR